MKYFFLAFYNYAKFKGRARRREFWLFLLFHGLFSFSTLYLDGLAGSSFFPEGPGIFCSLYLVLMFVPTLSITVRRLHDTGNSGWMNFLNLIPVVGNIWFLFLMISGGHRRRNKYGENPRKMKFSYQVS